MSKPSIERIIELQKFLHVFAQIERVIHRAHNQEIVRENDTEHSYNLAITAWFLASYFPELKQEQVIKQALVHDLVEVYAGDTYIYADEATLASKASREAEAAKKIKDEWADFPEMTEYIEIYEARESNEARFVYALDKIMPIITIYINDGYTWQKEGINLAQLRAVKDEKVSTSPEIEPYYLKLIDILEKSPHLIPPK